MKWPLTENAPATCVEKTCANTGGFRGPIPANCGTNAVCTDDGVGYTCTCEAGFYGSTTTNAPATCVEMTCADTDGAATPTPASCGTGATCTEDGDGYTCTCDAGFSGSTTTNEAALCADVDECGLETDDCDANALCENFAGTFNCTCLDGYAGNGTSCDPLPDKTSAAIVCTIPAGMFLGGLVVALPAVLY
jgi:hypothetical protein